MTSLLYSIVIPVYNSQEVVSATVERTLKYFESCKRDCEIVLINDGSSDDSWRVIRELAELHPKVSAINLLKNYGQHTANMCGFFHIRGDWVLTMDDDLQNPPEEIEKLIDKARDGYDFVCGRFEQKRHGIGRRLGSWLMRWINQSIFGTPPGFVHTNFRLIRRDVIDRIKEYRTFYPYTSGLCAMFSNRQANTSVRHDPRKAGVSGYT